MSLSLGRFACCGFVSLLFAFQPALAQKPRLTGPINSGESIPLALALHPLAKPGFDAGPLDPAMKLDYVTLGLKATAAQQADLQALLLRQQDRSSTDYHRWLTPEQFGERFGVSPDDLAAIRSWLSANGLHVEATARARNWIAFSGTAAQIDRVFKTGLHRFLVDGRQHFANTAPPSAPPALADLILFFRGLDDFDLQPPVGITRDLPVPAYTSPITGLHSLAPDDFAAIYDVTPLYQNNIHGEQQKIAVLGRTDIDMPGYVTFRNLYGLPPTTPLLHLVGVDPGTSQVDLGEAMLDLEWSGAVARNAQIIYVYATSISVAAQEAVDQNLAPVISSSYSSCEPEVADTLRYMAQQANAQGITWLVVTNDSGAAACDRHNVRDLASDGFAISYPASIPEITAVGGTMFNDAAGNFWNSANATNGASVLSYIPETGWNQTGPDFGIFAGGGGVSILYPKPLWQNGPGIPVDGARDIPDVSMAAATVDGYRTYLNGADRVTGGTSAATPAFAGIVALLNQYEVAQGRQSAPGMGNINPQLYRLAQTVPAAFHDVTTGDNNVPCVQSSPDCATGSFGYSAGPGYDLVTGLGSVDVNQLITHWNQTGAASATTVAASASSIAYGTSPVLTATVTAAAGSGTPSGTVTFLIPGGDLGMLTLGSAQLSATGAATIIVTPNQLALGANTVTAVYSGDAAFDGSSGSTALTVAAPAHAAVIEVKVSPDPVFAQASVSGQTSWYFSITLSELAGVAATLTDFSVGSTDLASKLSEFFPSGTSIPANGALSSVNLVFHGLTPPQSFVLAFSGTDVNGNAFNQQITVAFIGQVLEPEIVLTGAPSTVQQNPAGGASCPWRQRLELQELNGFGMHLTKFLAGTTDLTSQITQYFGTAEIAPFGALEATMCTQGAAPPAPLQYEIDAQSDNGAGFHTLFITTFSGPPTTIAGAAAPALTATPSGMPLATAASGSASGSINVALPAGTAWSAAVFPANRTTSWLTIGAALGTGPGTIALTANAAGQEPGVYRATVVVTASDTVPQYVEVPVTFTIGASSTISIAGVANAASFQTVFAPGMILAVFGTNLAPSTEEAGSVPLALSMLGVSATVNGVAAPLYYISPGQINLQIPYETGAGPAVVGVNNNGAVASFPITVQPSAPGIFVSNGALVPASTGSPGGYLTLFMTGEGDVSPELFTGDSPSPFIDVSDLPAPILPVTVTVGGVAAPVAFEGIPPFLVGVTQINFVIPAGVAAGTQPVVVTSNGIQSMPANIVVSQ